MALRRGGLIAVLMVATLTVASEPARALPFFDFETGNQGWSFNGPFRVMTTALGGHLCHRRLRRGLDEHRPRLDVDRRHDDGDPLHGLQPDLSPPVCWGSRSTARCSRRSCTVHTCGYGNESSRRSQQPGTQSRSQAVRPVALHGTAPSSRLLGSPRLHPGGSHVVFPTELPWLCGQHPLPAGARAVIVSSHLDGSHSPVDAKSSVPEVSFVTPSAARARRVGGQREFQLGVRHLIKASSATRGKRRPSASFVVVAGGRDHALQATRIA